MTQKAKQAQCWMSVSKAVVVAEMLQRELNASPIASAGEVADAMLPRKTIRGVL